MRDQRGEWKRNGVSPEIMYYFHCADRPSGTFLEKHNLPQASWL
jgi:hypothetical protein